MEWIVITLVLFVLIILFILGCFARISSIEDRRREQEIDNGYTSENKKEN